MNAAGNLESGTWNFASRISHLASRILQKPGRAGIVRFTTGTAGGFVTKRDAPRCNL